MTSRERILAALDGRPTDRVPLTTWCFGLPAPPELRWETNGRSVPYWYSKRLEHIHTLPHPWELADEFKRALAWRSLGVDDILDVSVPWRRDEPVTFSDSVVPKGAGGGDDRYPVLVREYDTPAGRLRHAVRKTGEEGAGWPVQPDAAPLFEDYNIPRAVQHLVSSPGDVAAAAHLYVPPGEGGQRWFRERVAEMKVFADREGFPMQAWSAFGMDAVVWMTGTQGAIMLAMDDPEAFARLCEAIAATDYARTELAAATDGVDLVVQRGWYSSTDFWSPDLFDRFVLPYVKELAALTHRHRKKFAYVMTTGVETLGPRLADAGVDVLYFVDPVQDGVALDTVRDRLADRMTVVGGTNALSLASGDPARIRDEVRRAVEMLGPTQRFILHPVDAVFPDTPWAGIRRMIETCKECGGNG